MSACADEWIWIIAAMVVGGTIGALAGVIVGELVRRYLDGAAVQVPAAVEHGPAVDLDDAAERRRFEEWLARRNGGRP